MNLFSRFQGLWNATRAIYIWSTSLRDSVFSDGEYKRERERKSGRNFEKLFFLEDEIIDREFLYILIQFKRILIVNDNNNERQKIRGFSEFT